MVKVNLPGMLSIFFASIYLCNPTLATSHRSNIQSVSFGPKLALAQGGRFDPASFTELHSAVQNRLLSNWSSSCNSVSPVFVSFLIGDDGKIYDPEIQRYSSNDQYNAECLEAVCSLSPLPRTESNDTAKIEHYSQEFGVGGGLRPSYDGHDVKEFLQDNLERSRDRKPFVLVHRIPLSVLVRYPGMFTQAEIQGKGNLFKIAGEYGETKPDKLGNRLSAPQFVHQIANLYAFWDQCFRKQNVTKGDILQWAQTVDKHTN